ncbi:MAG: YihY/virulence factor BrkB family protein [Dehalococcoidia bacterium]
MAQWRVPLRILGRAVTNFIEDNGSHMAAAISYYALFSMFPLTLLAVSIFGLVLRNPAVQEQVLAGIIGFLPIQDQSIANSLRNVARLGPTLTIVSALGSLWSAGALSAALRSSLNVVFEVQTSRPWFRAKLIDYVFLPIVALPLLGGIVLTTAWRIAQAEVGSAFGFVPSPISLSWFWHAGALAIPFLLSFLAFLLTYWLLPNHRAPFRYLWPGALLAALGFEGLKEGFAAYVENFASFNVIYGSLGSVIVLLFWTYLTANIVLFGAEVSAEVPHVLHGEPRHGGSAEGNWRTSLMSLLRGLVLAGDQESAERPRRRPPPLGGGK